jgi:hypothetical protein
MKIIPGSIVTGKSGKPLKVLAVDEDILVLESTEGRFKAARSAVLKVLAPPPGEIQIGDYLKRRWRKSAVYPAALVGNEPKDNDYGVSPVLRAVVERLSNDGYWVRSIDDDEIFHVPITAIEDGVWEFKEFSDGQNLPPPNDSNSSPIHEDRPVPPILTTLDGFTIGDRVTMMDDYHVRAADTGTVELITGIGIQVLWDNNSPHEKLKQPPIMGRTFDSHELKRID